MCGIAGIWLHKQAHLDDADNALGAMLNCLVHRGPDDVGVWTDRPAGVWLGHRRLAIIDLSPLGHQPMVSADGRLVIVFNGEIYNFTELRRELEAQGMRFSSNSDTEVLLAGYRVWRERVVDHLVGMYAFAIWDVSTAELFLARDRAGEKPLYYASGPWGFAFASELQALAELPNVSDEIDPDALSLYLRYQYVPAPYSIYKGARKLPPGHAMKVTPQRLTAWRYWDPVAVAAEPLLRISEEDALAELETRLRTAVRGQMISDVPLGAFLSGGIDSTAIVSLMTELSTTRVRTFTIGFHVQGYDESAHADAVARHLGTDHTAEYLTERNALDIIAQVPAMYGEPFADSSALPTHLLSITARRQVTVSLSGDGGDEAFGGYTRYDHLVLGHRLSRLAGPLGSLLRPMVGRLPGKIGRGGALLGLPPREIYRRLVRLVDPEDVRALTGRLPVLQEFDRAWASAADRTVLQKAMLADLLTYLPEAILVKVDRAAMRTSLETRAPILDHRVLEFALRLPPALLRQKRLLKQLVYRRVPRQMVDRPKMGFGVPLARWFRGELRPLLLDVLTPTRMHAAGVQNFGVVQRMLDEHMSDAAGHGPRLWALLVLGLWYDGRRGRRQARPIDSIHLSSRPLPVTQ